MKQEISFNHLNSVDELEYNILKKIDNVKKFLKKNENLTKEERASFESIINLLGNCFDFIYDVAKDVEKYEMSKIIMEAQNKRIAYLSNALRVSKLKNYKDGTK